VPSKLEKSLTTVIGGMVVLSAGLFCAGQSRAETEQVVISGLQVLQPDWDSGIGFGLYSATSDGDDTITITNLQITGADWTYADGSSGLVNESPAPIGDVSADLTTTSGTETFTTADWPEPSTVTGIDSITLQDNYGNIADETSFYNTFWVTSKTVSTISFDVNFDISALGPDESNPDLFYVYLTNCGWPPLLLPTDAPDGVLGNPTNDLIYVPLTSTNPAFQIYPTVAGSGNTSNLPSDTNYPGITATVPEPSPLAALAIGIIGLGGLAVYKRKRRSTN
jgi:hypothetical protein